MTKDPISRRVALARLALGATGLYATACALGESLDLGPISDGRLTARPQPDVGPPSPGLSPLLLQPGRDGVVFVPTGLPADRGVPLVLMLHGAGGTALGIEEVLEPLAQETGCVLLVPDSRGPTWDIVSGTYGLDIEYINGALAQVFSLMTVDPQRLGIAGFSDGASYALGLGRINGDLFKHVLAFSPGFLPPGNFVGKPPIYISHGTEDQVLPLEATSRLIVEDLMARGYDVTFREFQGGHVMSAALVREAFGLVVGPAPA